MKKLFTILLFSSIYVFGQISGLDGLNIPGSFNGWTQPPGGVYSSVQGTNPQIVRITTGTHRYQTTLKVAASGADMVEGSYAWLFTSGTPSNYWANKWADVAVLMNTLQTYNYYPGVGGSDNTVNVLNGKWYTVNYRDAGTTNTSAIWMETTGQPVTVTNATQDPPDPEAGEAVTVNITTSGTPPAEQKIYVRYTSDNWVSSSVVLATGSGTSWSATIPGSAVVLGDGNNYYILTTTVTNPSHADADMVTINFLNNGGSNYPLPVELTSFTAKNSSGTVTLNWQTATEVNNHGFEIERKTSTSDWSKIGFVEGHGSTNSPKYYSYSDKPSGTGKISYRLKQIDNDGQFEYSPVVEVLVDNLPNGFVLEQNYPNPFNPETSIRFALKEDTKASLKVFNTMGQEVATLFDGIAEAGRYYDVKFSSNELSSGFYIYKLVAGDFVSVKKMLLMK